jgi:hypothetical protein
MTTTTTTTCNLNCICDNSDCNYKHYISYKDRKIVKKFYDTITINKDEPNVSTRKKNCTFGQLCDKETCGFRHRLNFSIREKLIVLYKFNKICPEKSNDNSIKHSKQFDTTTQITSHNLYLSLDNDDEENTINTVPTTSYSEKSWADIVSTVPVIEPVSVPVIEPVVSRWEDMADDDFYMKF